MKSLFPLLALCAVPLLAACGASQGAAEIGEVVQELELVGNLVARRRTTVVTEVDGVIRTIAEGRQTIERELDGERSVETLALGLGERVDEGDVLVQIDPQDYELALAAAQSALTAAQTELAVLEACPVRLRPILMTAFSTIAGIPPIALGLGEGAATRAPMGTAVIGGMVTSTLLTLIVIPVMYSLVDDFGAAIRRLLSRSPKPAQEVQPAALA